ncbi:E3 ubiquitin-protein ligase SHPRH-like [Achlya hypogyna]|uniref:E3 ubiquitin-protein ligase SHPRH-like n=1 Tax=Achlya hypogyna TaxID=1202772 RepID=A0A1V9YHQ1_ACHHY|nr:E3 ubiquitin-protein ligase SHPRH-like [Achlya hypogyna]
MNPLALLDTTRGAHSEVAIAVAQPPPQLRATTVLHDHQRAALAWMAAREAGASVTLLGGILADGPGLGKTLTTLSCMALLPSPEPTLVVVPNALIAEQWLSEMTRHFEPETWTIVKYNPRNHKKLAFARNVVSPVVFVTLGDLGLEWHMLQSEQSERGRATSELFHLHWHRIVVDEVQDILGTGTSLAASMIQALDARVRWGLSATPLSKPTDMLGLAKYLAIPPYNVSSYWYRLNPDDDDHVASMQALLHDIVWRTPAHYAVENLHLMPRQIQLPMCFVHMSALEFAAYLPDYERAVKDVAKKLQPMCGVQRPIALAKLRSLLAHPSVLKMCKGASHVGLNATSGTRDFSQLLDTLVQHRWESCNYAAAAAIERCLDANTPEAAIRGYQLLASLEPFRVPWTLSLRVLTVMRRLAYASSSIGLRHEVHRTVLAYRRVSLPQTLWRYIFNDFLHEDFTGQIDRLVATYRAPLRATALEMTAVVRTMYSGMFSSTFAPITTALRSYVDMAWETDDFRKLLADATKLRTSAAHLGTYERWVNLDQTRESAAAYTRVLQDVVFRAKAAFAELKDFLDAIPQQDWDSNDQGLLQAFDMCDHGRRRMNRQVALGREARWRQRDAALAGGRGAQGEVEACFLCRLRSAIDKALGFWRSEGNYPTLFAQLLTQPLVKSIGDAIASQVIACCQHLYALATDLEAYVRRSIEVYSCLTTVPAGCTIDRVDAAFSKLDTAKGYHNYVTRLRTVQAAYASKRPPTCDRCCEPMPEPTVCRLLVCGHVVCAECAVGSACAVCGAGSPFPPTSAPTIINPSAGTKYDCISRDILDVVTRPTADKCIVFSQWHQGLVLLKEALAALGVASLHLERTSQTALREQFQASAGIRVLLLPLKKYNHGLNLVEAKHVFLIEPTLQPAMEEQAMARVQRLSQTQTTYVHRYAVADTVEARIVEWTRKARTLTQDDAYRIFFNDPV